MGETLGRMGQGQASEPLTGVTLGGRFQIFTVYSRISNSRLGVELPDVAEKGGLC